MAFLFAPNDHTGFQLGQASQRLYVFPAATHEAISCHRVSRYKRGRACHLQVSPLYLAREFLSQPRGPKQGEQADWALDGQHHYSASN